jgi:hypothetical protein
MTLMNDEHVAFGLRETLDCSEPVVLHALTLAVPNATRDERSRCFRLARGAMHAALVEFAAALDSDRPEDLAVEVDSAADFVHAGMAALLR